MRLLKPDSGEILFQGKNIYGMDARELRACRQRMQLVFQDPSASLSPRRTIRQSLLEPLQHFSVGDRRFRTDKIRETLETVGLDPDSMHRYPHQFSSGQQQRIAIARALITDPDLLIADESVSSLDVSVQAQILQLIQTLQRDLGIAFLFITHDLAVIRQIADDIAVMYGGQLLEQSPADSFFSQPAHPYSELLLSFADDTETPNCTDGDKWLVGPSRNTSAETGGCIYSHHCAKKIPICESLEPGNHQVRDKNHHAESLHCVKCHLYGQVNSNEN